MKKIILLSIALVSFFSVNAQKDNKIGIKAGFNYNMASADLSDAPDGAWDAIKEPKVNNGWHLGINYRSYWGNIFYWQPELIYSQTSNTLEHNNGSEWINTEFDNKLLDLNVLVGVELLDFVRAYAGPTAIFNLGSSQSDNDIETSFESFRMGYQIGAGLDLLSFLTVDVAYKGSFSSDNGSINVAGVEVPITESISQIHLSVGILF